MKVTGVGSVAPPAGEPEAIVVDGRELLIRRAPNPTTIAAREARRLTRPALFALAASLPFGSSERTDSRGVALGTGYGAVEPARHALEGLFERADYISPVSFVASVRHDPATVVARVLKLHGPSAALSARRLSFEQALGWALVQLRRERAESMVVVGADEVTPLRARSPSRGRLAKETIVDGEGAGALLIERDDSPRPALARIEGVVEGVGSADDLVAAVKRDLGDGFDAVFTDEDGSARRAAIASAVASAFVCDRFAVAESAGHIASGGALVAVRAVEAMKAARKRVLCYAREADGTFAAYSVTRP